MNQPVEKTLCVSGDVLFLLHIQMFLTIADLYKAKSPNYESAGGPNSRKLTLLLLYLEVQAILILSMYVRFGQNLDSFDCLLGGRRMWILLMYVRFGQNTVSVTCLLGGLQHLDFAYVRKVLADY